MSTQAPGSVPFTSHQIKLAEGAAADESSILNAAKDSLSSVVWDESVGPLENILGWVDMSLLLIPSGIFQIASLVASMMGLTVSRIGKILDDKLELQTLQDLQSLDPEAAVEKMIGMSHSEQALAVDEFKNSSLTTFPSNKISTGAKTPQERFDDEVELSELRRRHKVTHTAPEAMVEIGLKPKGVGEFATKVRGAKFTKGVFAASLLFLLRWAGGFVKEIGKWGMANPVKSAIVGAATVYGAYKLVGDSDAKGDEDLLTESAKKTIQNARPLTSREKLEREINNAVLKVN